MRDACDSLPGVPVRGVGEEGVELGRACRCEINLPVFRLVVNAHLTVRCSGHDVQTPGAHHLIVHIAYHAIGALTRMGCPFQCLLPPGALL